jgi:hypothetical protein
MSGMNYELDGSHRGEYGTREGDKWLAPGSDIQNRLDQEGKGLVLIHEMMVKDGELQEVVYVTALPDLIEEATRGHERYVAAQAERN